MATCPECEYDEIDTEDFEDGDALSCLECGSALVFTGGALDFAADDVDDAEEAEEAAEDDEDKEGLDE
jgi:hypothetical protein